MNDDLNTSGALAILFELARPLRALANRIERGDMPAFPGKDLTILYSRWQLLVRLAGVLGLKAEKFQKQSCRDVDIPSEKEIQKAIDERKAAKSQKDFAKADKIREELKSFGVQLIDKPGGETDWLRF